MNILSQLDLMIYVWIGAMVLFLIIEAAVPGLVSLWFALGSLAALVSAFFKAPLWLQIVWFLVISVITLILTRPLAKKYVNGKKQPTNADRVIGMTGIVTEPIDNVSASGAVTVGGKVWTARSAEENPIATGERVRVERIEGVKLFVVPEENEIATTQN